MLLPWPILLAFFFVFQNTIELRGALVPLAARPVPPDPPYIIPIVMGLSMYAPDQDRPDRHGAQSPDEDAAVRHAGDDDLSVPQLPSGLNLYYTVMNIASLPQQWMLSKERLRRMAKISPTPAPALAPATPKPKKKSR